MSQEFIDSFIPQFERSPSPSDADNDLVLKLIDDLAQTQSSSQEAKKAIVHILLAWQTKKLPRYLLSENGSLTEDNLSGPLWSPAYNRIYSSLTQLEVRLRGTDVFDPFAGSGSMEHALLSLDIPNSVTLNDRAYIGGKPITTIEQIDYYYNPKRNLIEYVNLFRHFSAFADVPDFNRVLNYNSVDLSLDRLPYNNNEFDWVFTDPPYGRSLKSEPNNNILFYLPEILRVSRYGALFIIPEEWVNGLVEKTPYYIEKLTGTLSHKATRFKTVLVSISNKN
jgi:16S rRNA G966 N2-methylase RsmD